MSSYKNLAIIPPFQSCVALVENLWKPPKSTEFSSLLGAPPHYPSTRFAHSRQKQVSCSGKCPVQASVSSRFCKEILNLSHVLLNLSQRSKSPDY
jgi:hypothetical protein